MTYLLKCKVLDFFPFITYCVPCFTHILPTSNPQPRSPKWIGERI